MTGRLQQPSLVRAFAITTTLVVVTSTTACFFDDVPLLVGDDYRTSIPSLDASVFDASLDAGIDARPMDASEVDADEMDAGEVDAGEVDAGELDASEIDATTRRWVSHPLGEGDNDDASPLIFAPDNQIHVVTSLESIGRLNYLHMDGSGGWSQQYIDSPPSDSARRGGCPTHPTMALDNLGVAHVVYVAGRDFETPCTGTEIPTQILHSMAVSRGGFSEVIGSASEAVGPPALLIEMDVLHVVHRSDHNLVYFWYMSATRRTAAAIIPFTEDVERAALFRRSTGSLFIVYAKEGNLYHQTLTGEVWSTPTLIDEAGIVTSTAYDSANDLLHIVRQSADTLHYEALSLDSGAVRSENIVRARACDTLALAIDSHGAATIACGRHDIGVDILTRADGITGWRRPEEIRVRAGDPAPTVVVPTISFDMRDVPHVVFLSTGARALYYASPE